MDSFDVVTEVLDYPMFVVTTASQGQSAGCLVGFATQTSIDPPRFLVGLSVKNHTYRVAREASRVVVHVLDAESIELARLFGETTGDEVDKFAACAWQSGPDGVPVLEDAAAWFSGPLKEHGQVGDHSLFLLDIDAAEVRRKPSHLLLFSDVADFHPGHEA